MIGDIALLGVVFLIGYSFGYEDLLLDGHPRPKDKLDQLCEQAVAARKAYLERLNSEVPMDITT